MLMIEPNEARYHDGFHNQKLKNSYSYSSQNPNHNHPHFWPQNKTPLSSQYFGQNKETKTSPEEMMIEWMEGNESMKNHVVETKLGEKKEVHHTESLPQTTDSNPGHEFVYKPPSIRNEHDKGDVEFIEEDETESIPTMPNPNQIISSSLTVSPFLEDCTVHI